LNTSFLNFVSATPTLDQPWRAIPFDRFCPARETIVHCITRFGWRTCCDKESPPLAQAQAAASDVTRGHEEAERQASQADGERRRIAKPFAAMLNLTADNIPPGLKREFDKIARVMRSTAG
jgi:hypothetical protein